MKRLQLINVVQAEYTVADMASEEMEHIHQIPHRYPKGEYLLLFDPLDGSSNIDVNVSIGTIFFGIKSPRRDRKT